MYQNAAGEPEPSQVETFLADTDLFFFYLRGGEFEEQAQRVITAASSGLTILKTCSEVYDDAISAIRADEGSLELAQSFVADMKSITHTALPLGPEVAEDAIGLYLAHGGRRKLSYFDSFHVATARRHSLKFLTTDGFIIKHAKTLGVKVMDLSDWK